MKNRKLKKGDALLFFYSSWYRMYNMGIDDKMNRDGTWRQRPLSTRLQGGFKVLTPTHMLGTLVVATCGLGLALSVFLRQMIKSNKKKNGKAFLFKRVVPGQECDVIKIENPRLE